MIINEKIENIVDSKNIAERAKIRGMTDEQFEDLLDEDWWGNGMK